MITVLQLPLYTIIYYYSTILETELEKSFQQNGKKNIQRNSAVHAWGQMYRACGKKMAPDSNRPHGLTNVWKITLTFIFKISVRKDW